MTKTEGIRLVLISNQMVMKKIYFWFLWYRSACDTRDDSWWNGVHIWKKIIATRQEQHVICARGGPGRFNSACGIDSLNHQFTCDCNYSLRGKCISSIKCRTCLLQKNGTNNNSEEHLTVRIQQSVRGTIHVHALLTSKSFLWT